jgi:uncharacterized protein (UPF0262 family)
LDERRRIVNVLLDDDSLGGGTPTAAHERAAAVFDLLEDHVFEPADGSLGPFILHLSQRENRLVFDVRDESDREAFEFAIPVAAFRSIVRDYHLICDSYYEAIRAGTPSRIQAIDMGRRGMHNEGAELLQERMKPHVKIDLDTARRFFTLLCVLHMR